MKNTVVLQDKEYISARRAHELYGYSTDYIGQLCRSGKLESQMIGRSWYLTEESLIDHKSGIRKNYTKVIEDSTSKEENFLKENVQIEEHKDENKSFKYETEYAPFLPNIKKRTILLTSDGSTVFAPRSFSKSILHEVVAEEDLEFPKNYDHNNLRQIALTSLIVIIFFVSFQTFKSSKQLFTFDFRFNNPVNVASVIDSSNNILKSISRGFHGIVSIISNFNFKKNNIALGNDEGMKAVAIMPAGSSTQENDILEENVRQSFSDEVQVTPDISGDSGIITPVFKDSKGKDFLYVVLPLNEAKK